MLSDWVSFLAYPNLFGIKGFVVIVVVVVIIIYSVCSEDILCITNNVYFSCMINYWKNFIP
jgi:hypothetical protein